MEVSSLNITGVYVRGSMIIWENIDLVVKPPCGTEKLTHCCAWKWSSALYGVILKGESWRLFSISFAKVHKINILYEEKKPINQVLYFSNAREATSLHQLY